MVRGKFMAWKEESDWRTTRMVFGALHFSSIYIGQYSLSNDYRAEHCAALHRDEVWRRLLSAKPPCPELQLLWKGEDSATPSQEEI